MDACNIIINGRSACGKTHLLLKMIEGEFRGKYDFIVLICPTFEWNATYQNWKYIHDPNIIALAVDHDRVNDTLDFVSNVFQGTNSLIILDDCASSKDVKGQTSNLVKLGFSARHKSLSVLVLTQQLTSIALAFRQNVTRLITFYTPNRNDMKVLLDEYLYGVSKEEADEITKSLKDVKYCHLDIRLTSPYGYTLRK